MISTIYCLRLHHMVGQHALPSWLRCLNRIGPKILCLHTAPNKASDSEQASPMNEKPKEFPNSEMRSIYEELKFISGK